MLRTPRPSLISLVLPLLLAGSPPALAAVARDGRGGTATTGDSGAIGNRPSFTAEDAVRMALRNDRTLRGIQGDVETAAGRVVEAGHFPADAAKARLAFEVESAYHVLAAARGVLAVARTRSELAALAADSARAVAEAENAPPLPHLREAARREAAGIALAEAALAVLEAEERLVALLGGGVAGVRDAVAGVGAEPPALAPEPPDAPGLEDTAVAASLELAELRARLHAAEASSVDGRLTPTESLVRSAARSWGARLAATHARAARITGPVRGFHERVVSEALRRAEAGPPGTVDLFAACDAALRAEADAAGALRDLAIARAAVRALRSGVRPGAAPARREPGPADGSGSPASSEPTLLAVAVENVVPGGTADILAAHRVPFPALESRPK